MTNKDTFLNAIIAEIKSLQEAYEASKNLPDRVFDAIYSTINHHDIGKFNIAQPLSTNGSQHQPFAVSQDKFSGNKGIVYGIIKGHGKAIRKREILARFQLLCPKVKKPVDAVTFSLSGLRTGDVIKRYDPESSLKTGYWTLAEWWDGENLIDKHKPDASTTSFAMAG